MKKNIAIILSLIIVFSAVMIISGCNKNDENQPVINESTGAITEPDSSTESNSIQETESTSVENKNETEAETESATKETEPNHTEKPTNSDEPVTCDACGNIIASNSQSGDISIGNFCDGKCDEWLGEVEF